MKKSIARSTITVVSLTVLAKLFGFAKSVIQAAFFGASDLTDAYNMANGLVSNILYLLTMSVAAAYVPLYIKNKKKMGKSELFIDTSATLTKLGFWAILLTFGLVMFSPLLVKAVAPSYEGEQLKNTVDFFKIIVVGIVFSLETNMYQSILNAEKIYEYSAFTSIINSLVVILILCLGYKRMGIYSLVISVPISYLIQFVFLSLKGNKYGKLTIKRGIKSDTFKILVIQSIPVLISNATIEINQAVDRALLAASETGVITAVSYAATLYQFATSIISAPISSVVFTELSIGVSEGNNDYLLDALNTGIKLLTIVCIPIMIVAYSYSCDIVSLIYGHGSFDEYAISKTAIALSLYSFCIWSAVVKQFVTRAFYAVNDTKDPTIVSVLEVITNIIISIFLSKRFGYAGVVGATAISCFLFTIIMIIVFGKKHGSPIKKSDSLIYLKIAISCLACVIITHYINFSFKSSSILTLVLNSLKCFLIYFCILVCLGEPTIKNFTDEYITKITRRLKK